MSVLRGDCVEVMAGLADNSIDAIVTDPPYGLEFMGKDWDSFGDARHPRTAGRVGDGAQTGGARIGDSSAIHGVRVAFGGKKPTTSRCLGCGKRDQFRKAHECAEGWTMEPLYDGASKASLGFEAWTERWAREAYRILKPGGHLLAFGGSRTYHRLAAGIEDAGFEIRDQLMWVYASGFPKSLDVSKATDAAREWSGWGTALKPAHEPIVMARKPLIGTVAQNVQEHGTGALNIDGCRVKHNEPCGQPSDGMSGRRNGILGPATQRHRETTSANTTGRWPANVILTDPVFDGGWDGVVGGGEAPGGISVQRNGGGGVLFGKRLGDKVLPDAGYGDIGTYSRFFLVPKAPSRERTLTDGRRSPHPTQKPEALIRHLVTMVTPPGGIVLDPFLGSGTLGVACEALGVRWLGIEREDEYADWAEDRIADRKAKWEVPA